MKSVEKNNFSSNFLFIGAGDNPGLSLILSAVPWIFSVMVESAWTHEYGSLNAVSLQPSLSSLPG